jgi:hypothetical protein
MNTATTIALPASALRASSLIARLLQVLRPLRMHFEVQASRPDLVGCEVQYLIDEALPERAAWRTHRDEVDRLLVAHPYLRFF